MGKSILSGLPSETRKQIIAQIKAGKKLVAQQDEQEYEKYWTGLNALKKQIDGLVDKAKASGSVPRGTTLKRLTMMPKAKPTRWSSVFKRIFGRKTKKVAVQNKKATPKTKKAAFKPKSVGAMAVGADGLTKHQRHEANRVRTPEQSAQRNEQRR